ncbi:response regulator transcription factor [Thalassobaculum sp.]|uniref:response regulator transcription factor n=1 Tax=Thalassobaculum sp. TaxID=2022740 RepID=UPI0032EE61F3
MDEKNIVIIDTSRLFREGMRHILNGSAFNIVADAASHKQLDGMVDHKAVDIVLVEDSSRAGELDELLCHISQLAPAAKTIFLGNTVELPRLIAALTAGADGYLLKDLSANALLQSLTLVLLGEKVFPTDLATVLTSARGVRDPMHFQRSLDGFSPRAQRSPLTERELQIVACLVNGGSNKLIANQLQITEGTVKAHIKALLKKLGLKNRTQAAIWAVENGHTRDVADLGAE